MTLVWSKRSETRRGHPQLEFPSCIITQASAHCAPPSSYSLTSMSIDSDNNAGERGSSLSPSPSHSDRTTSSSASGSTAGTSLGGFKAGGSPLKDHHYDHARDEHEAE